MRNFLIRGFTRYRFSTQTTGAKSEPSAQFLEQFKQAVSFYSQRKYRISNEFYSRALRILEKEGLKDTDNYVQVIKKMVRNHNKLRNYQEAQKLLTDIVEISQRTKANVNTLYSDYNNLFLHCIRTNLNKSILLGKALLSEKQKELLPLTFHKLFTLNLGTAYLLRGNYVDAKQRLKECLFQAPNDTVKGYALNNLAVASWWHKHPNYRALEDEEEQQDNSSDAYSAAEVDQDFKNVIPLLKNALYYLEGVDGIADKQLKMNLQKLLDVDKIVPQDPELSSDHRLLISCKASGTPLQNINEFLLSTNPEKKKEAMFWFRYSLKFFQTHDTQSINKSLITLALFCMAENDYVRAEKLYLKVIENLQDTDDYNRVLALQLYGKMLKKLPDRNMQGTRLLQEAYNVADKLPYWSNKMVHISLPELEL